MVFDEEFETIEGGRVRCFRRDGSEDEEPTRFGTELHYERVSEQVQDFIILMRGLGVA